ncbi:MAG: DUF3343 domain-containing protein [Clostridiales bacterium]
MNKDCFVLTFDSTHQAIAMEKRLRDFQPVMMPTPRQLSSGCGFALKISQGEEQALAVAVAASAIDCRCYRVAAGRYREILP